MLQNITTYFKKNKYRKLFENEYAQFLNTQKFSGKGYKAFRKMFVLTQGQSNDVLSERIAQQVGKYEAIPQEGVLKNSDKSALEQFRKDGYYVFDACLDETTLQEIYKYAATTPVSYLKTETGAQDYSEDKVIFDETHPISPRYQYTRDEILQCKALQKLTFDFSLLQFAQDYLGCKPILDLVAFWWSAPFNGVGKNSAAQMYHFDLDRIKFIKFFFYITDVDTATGPHCYVKGSHGKLPKQVNRDGRFEDAKIEQI